MNTWENEDEICRRHFYFPQKIGGDPCAKFLGELSMGLGRYLVLNEHDSCHFSLGDSLCSYNPPGSGLEEFAPYMLSQLIISLQEITEERTQTVLNWKET